MNSRRKFVIALGASALSAFPVFAQQQTRVRRIGFLNSGSIQNSARNLRAFREGMAALRWVEGRDYTIDPRYAEGVESAMSGMASELVATGPDLLLTGGDRLARLLNERTKSIPIVFCIVQDPVGGGLATSLQHPGGNVTGLTTLARELAAKRLQLIKEMYPRVAHVVVLFDPMNRGSVSEVKDIEEGAARLKVRVTAVEIQKAADVEAAFKRGTALDVQAYMMTQGGVISFQYQLIAERGLSAGRPTMAAASRFVELGGLISYAASFDDNYRRAAGYVDKIFKGAKPSDLPIEQPTKFELVINLKTAKALGIKIPNSILVRADQVIE